MLFKSIPVDWTVIPGVKQVKVYNDEEMTSPFIALHFGEIPQGETRDFTFYVRNEGKIVTDVVIMPVGDPGDATVSLMPNSFNLAAGESVSVVIEIVVSPISPLETGAITLEVSDGEA